MSRRKRCPYCKSINTAEVIIASKTEWTGILHTCDDCDQSFNEERRVDGKWVKVPNEGTTLESPRKNA